MDSSSILQKRYLSINPVNSGEGVYGYSSGLPQLIFNLGSSGILQTEEVRLSFNLRIVESGSTTNNVDPAKQVSCGFVNGAESVMDEIEISSTNYGRSLERIDHYARMNASVTSATHSNSHYDSHLPHDYGPTGGGGRPPRAEWNYQESRRRPPQQCWGTRMLYASRLWSFYVPATDFAWWCRWLDAPH